MSEQEKQENQKTIVAFAAGLLIGGLLVWIFGGAPRTQQPDDQNDETAQTGEEVDVSTSTTDDADAADDADANDDVAVMQTGEGSVDVENQTASTVVALNSATFPTDEGWVGVRDYVDGQIGGILGVARFSKAQGLIPEEISLQRSTKAGNEYAVVFFSENGDRIFNTANDKQEEGVAGTFTAQ